MDPNIVELQDQAFLVRFPELFIAAGLLRIQITLLPQ